MRVLVTGSVGFVGKNLISFLNNLENIEVLEFNKNNSLEQLTEMCQKCNFVYHLAGVNRPKDPKEYMEGNYNLTKKLIDTLQTFNNKCPIVFSSSIQAEIDNDYGKSKKASEDLLFEYAKSNDVKVYVYRFPNLFGKWCLPNYNSVIATFCYNIANNLSITVNDENKELTLAYIDDVCNELLKCLNDKVSKEGNFCTVPITYKKTLGYIANLIISFKKNSNNIYVPSTGDDFIKKLYSTYISYVPLKEMIVNLEEHRDNRGVFCELVRTNDCGQFSVSTTKPYIARGGHYHHTKMERFIVIKGKAKIIFEHIITHEKIEFEVSGEKLQYVTIPVGYFHSINNIGDDELILFIWANELFDDKNPDTYVMEEQKK